MDDSFKALFTHNQEPVDDTETEIQIETPETETQTEEVAEPVETPKVETAKEDRKNWVPVDALLEERTKRQEAEKLRAEYETKLREAETQKQRNSRPDPFDSPDDYDAYVRAQIASAIEADRVQREQERLNATFGQSVAKANEVHGEETVKSVLNWAQQRATIDDAWGREGLSQPDPVSWIIEQHNRHTQFEEFARDPEGFKAKLLAELGNANVDNSAAATQPRMADKVSAPKSLANTGSSGKSSTSNTQSGDDAFRAIFKK